MLTQVVCAFDHIRAGKGGAVSGAGLRPCSKTYADRSPDGVDTNEGCPEAVGADAHGIGCGACACVNPNWVDGVVGGIPIATP